MNFIFLMDPLETVVKEKDTSFIQMVAAVDKGHKVFYLNKHGLTRLNGKTFFHVTHVTPHQDASETFTIHEQVTLTEDNVDAVFIRTDPPFDQTYLEHTWLLERLPQRIAIINRPEGIRTVNEKIWATQFTNLIPPTMVSSQKDDLLQFIHNQKKVVVKPTDGFGGQSVFILNEGDTNNLVTLETLTNSFTKNIIAQQFIPEAQSGDKRILLLNGEPLGAVLRLHNTQDHRNNFFAGGSAEDTEITDRDLHIIKSLKPHLQDLGLYFVGIDILGDFLIEVNVTSPTCLQEMMHFSGKPLHLDVITFVESLISQKS